MVCANLTYAFESQMHLWLPELLNTELLYPELYLHKGAIIIGSNQPDSRKSLDHFGKAKSRAENAFAAAVRSYKRGC